MRPILRVSTIYVSRTDHLGGCLWLLAPKHELNSMNLFAGACIRLDASQRGLNSESQAVDGNAVILLAQSPHRLYFVTFSREIQGLFFQGMFSLLGITRIGTPSLMRISDVAELTIVPDSERLHCDMVPLVTRHKVDGNESERTPPITALFLQLFVSLLGQRCQHFEIASLHSSWFPAKNCGWSRGQAGKTGLMGGVGE